MIVKLIQDITPEQRQSILDQIAAMGHKTMEVSTQYDNYIVGVGEKEFDIRAIGNLEGVRDVHRVTDTYKLVSRKWKVKDTAIDLGDDVVIRRGDLAIMAGPCSIEGEEQIEKTVEHLKANDVRIMRGGVFKPRSSPYSFRGLGTEGLKVFHQKCREAGIKIITEVMQVSQIEEMIDHIDIFQVGARNAQNFDLLDALGRVDKPVMLKRGVSGTIDELLNSAEYVFSNGNERILLCERGIRTYEKAYRNTLDLNAVAMLKEMTHLPVIADPSHGIGLRRFVPDMALASVMAGADGVILEVHETPEKAFSDGQQTLSFHEAGKLYDGMRRTLELREELTRKRVSLEEEVGV